MTERHTVDSITSDALDQLYDDRDRAQRSATHRLALLGKRREQIRALEAEVARLHEGEEPLPDERMAPTPTQWLWLWNRATPAKRLKVAAQVMDDAARAGRCFMGDHEKTIDHYRRRAERAKDEVARLTAGQCTDSRRMCDLHHTVPVAGCPYPRCINAREREASRA